MAMHLLIVESTCKDPAREAEFNEWYSNTHVPDVMTEPHCIKATRWEDISPAEGNGKYIAIYEIETDDIYQTKKAMDENVAAFKAKGRGSDLIESLSHRLFKQISSRTK